MKKILLILLITSTGTHSAVAQDLKLWYNKPAAKWTDALPIGNGRLGAMVFGGVSQDHLQFNEETLWTGEPRDYNRKGAYKYLPQLRQLLFDGKQKEAEQLAEKEFMGLKSNEGKKVEWVSAIASFKGVPGNPSLKNFDDSRWKTMRVPSYEGWEAVGFEGLDGAVWLRTEFVVPKSWLGKNLVLDLNRVRDHDYTYVNGSLVGSMESTEARRYVIKKGILQERNTLAIQVLNYFDKGGVAGYKDASRHIGVYVEGDEKSKISLDGNWKYFIQDDAPPAVPRYQADYQPFGDVWLNFKDHVNPTGYKRDLDLTNAISTTTYFIGNTFYTKEYFVSQPHDVIAAHFSSSSRHSISFEISLSSPHKNSVLTKLDNTTVALKVKVRNGALHGESRLQVQASGGKIVWRGDTLVVSGADDASVYLAAATNYKNYRDVSADPAGICATVMRRLNNITYSNIKASHIREYQHYFNTFSINLGRSESEKFTTDERIRQFATTDDPSFAALYVQYGRYLLISSSRPGSRPANLQGIWNDLLTPPWGSKYTTNINLEMNYWPAELLNLSAMHGPLFTMIKELSVSGATTAREYYNAPGWVLHHNTDVWRGTAPINASNHGIWVTGGAWLSHHLWEHYLFTQDKDFLRKVAYPVMRSAADFFCTYLVKDPKTGWLISGPSNSPEQGGLVMGPSMDHQIIRSLLKATIAAADRLAIDGSFSEKLAATVKQMAPDQIGKYGQLQEWLSDIDDTTNKHRHVSHLWSVYPGKEITWTSDTNLMKAARQSLLYRGDAATGWSLGWKINFWARFKDGDHALQLIRMLLSPAEKGGAGSYVNLFDAHPPFQIDGNFGGAAGIGEMIVQSHEGYIDILPALPHAWKTGEVKGICARGGFVLNITWKDGTLQGVEVLSTAGTECKLRYKDLVAGFATTKGRSYRMDAQLKMMK